MTTLLRGLLHNAELMHVSKEIERVAQPSIRLQTVKASPTQFIPGASRFGGIPDLSQGRSWPERSGSTLPFIAQINLSSLTQYPETHLLPNTGMLYFFFDLHAFFQTWPRDQTTWTVLYADHVPSEHWSTTIPHSINQPNKYQPCAIVPTPEVTLPDYSRYDSTALQRLGLPGHLTEKEEQAYHEVQSRLAQTTGATRHIPIHRLLGHADPVQWDMHRDLPEKGNGWQLLLQVDSDDIPYTDWGDTGRIYYWIRQQDLLRCDFSQVQLILQSS